MSKHTVLVILEAKPGKDNELKEALINVIKPSRAEKACLEYRLHQDSNDPTKFILYENWENAEAHQQQFAKPYIVNLADRLSDLLAKPFQVFFAKELDSVMH